MREDLPTMILLNIVLDIQQLENMEDESLSQAILHPIGSTILLEELMRGLILNTKTLKLLKT